MLLTLHTLPQLAVSAKLLCLLMVVICGAVPSMVRSVRLHNECSQSNVRVDLRGHVLTGRGYDDDDPFRFQNLTLRSHGFDMKISIQATESSRYICFNKRWKLVGLKKFRGSMCQFIERTSGGFLQYQSSKNSSHYMGFNARGLPIKRSVDSDPRQLKCFNFLKKDSNFNISHHNKKISEGNLPDEQPPLRQAGSRPIDERNRKVPGKNEPPGKTRHGHGDRKGMFRKPS